MFQITIEFLLPDMDRKRLELYVFLALLIGALVLVFAIFSPYMGALFLAATFAIVFEPLYRRVLHIIPGWEGTAAFVTIIAVLLVVFIPLTTIGLRVFDETRDLYAYFTHNSAQVSDTALTFMRKYIDPLAPAASLNLGQYIQQFLLWLLQNIGPIFASVTQMITNVFLSLFALYYLLKDGPRLKRVFIAISPLADHHDEQILQNLHQTVNSVVKGSLVMAIIQGILAGIGFLIFGLPHAAFLGSLSVLAALIPFFGTTLIVVPAAIYLFTVGETVSAIGLVIWGTFVVGLADNFLRPQLMKRGVSIHPFLILLSVLGGLRFFGPIGFLLGPLVLSFLFSLLHIYPHLVLGKANAE